MGFDEQRNIQQICKNSDRTVDKSTNVKKEKRKKKHQYDKNKTNRGKASGKM